MQEKRVALMEKLEMLFVRRAAMDFRMEKMSLGELLYYALVESAVVVGRE